MRGCGTLGKAGGAASVKNCGEVLRLQIVGYERCAVGKRVAREDDDCAAGGGDHVFAFGFGEARVHGDDHGSRHQNAEESGAPIYAVAEADGDAVAALDSHVAQTAGDASGAVPELRVSDSFAAQFDEGFFVRPFVDGGVEHVNQRLRAVEVTRDVVRTTGDAGVVEGADWRH